MMLSWFVANLSTIVIGMILLAVVALITAGMIHSKKKGKSSCACACSGCPMGGSCHQKK